MNPNWRSQASCKLFRQRCERLARGYAPGDLVFERETGRVGVVLTIGNRGGRIVFADGGGRGGAFLGIRHLKPRRNIPVPAGALGNRGWNRQQAVTVAIRRAGIEVRK